MPSTKGATPLTDIFQEVKERVSAQDAARHYGLTFNRRGWAVCPFHQDKHPSMSFRNGRYHCWVCDLQGDSIDLIGRLLGLEPMAAVERLNADFMLGLPLHRKPTPAEEQAVRRRQEIAEAHRAFEAWRADFIAQLNAAYCVAHLALQSIDTPRDLDRLSPAEAAAIQWQAAFEYWADALTTGEAQEQMEIFRDRQVIQSRIDQTLSNTRMKSETA